MWDLVFVSQPVPLFILRQRAAHRLGRPPILSHTRAGVARQTARSQVASREPDDIVPPMTDQTPAAARPQPTRLYRWLVLVFISVAMFGNYYVYDCISPLADV